MPYYTDSGSRSSPHSYRSGRSSASSASQHTQQRQQRRSSPGQMPDTSSDAARSKYGRPVVIEQRPCSRETPASAYTDRCTDRPSTAPLASAATRRPRPAEVEDFEGSDVEFAPRVIPHEAPRRAVRKEVRDREDAEPHKYTFEASRERRQREHERPTTPSDGSDSSYRSARSHGADHRRGRSPTVREEAPVDRPQNNRDPIADKYMAATDYMARKQRSCDKARKPLRGILKNGNSQNRQKSQDDHARTKSKDAHCRRSYSASEPRDATPPRWDQFRFRGYERETCEPRRDRSPYESGRSRDACSNCRSRSSSFGFVDSHGTFIPDEYYGSYTAHDGRVHMGPSAQFLSVPAYHPDQYKHYPLGVPRAMPMADGYSIGPQPQIYTAPSPDRYYHGSSRYR